MLHTNPIYQSIFLLQDSVQFSSFYFYNSISLRYMLTIIDYQNLRWLIQKPMNYALPTIDVINNPKANHLSVFQKYANVRNHSSKTMESLIGIGQALEC